MATHAAPHQHLGLVPGHRRHHAHLGGRWRPGGLLVAVGLLGLLMLLLRPDSHLGGWGWPGAGVQTPTPVEALGMPSAGHPPLALTGPRGIVIVAGLQDGRQRFGQFVEPGPPGLSGGGLHPGTGPPAAAPPPVHLVTRGHVGVRAPPEAHG